MILLIDNYDSFVFNLARYLAEMGCGTHVVRNDATSIETIQQMAPEAIILSPGPRTPQEAGLSVQIVRELGERIPILGVCLGHQAVAAAFGASVIRAPEPVHGRTSLIHHNQDRLFAGLTNPLRATRYHSLVVSDERLPSVLKVTAQTDDRLIMGIEHHRWPIFGVQFHPESILTESGHQLLHNFLILAGVKVPSVPISGHERPVLPRNQPCDAGIWPEASASSERPLHW